MAITQEGSVSTYNANIGASSFNITHTVTADTDLVIVFIGQENNDGTAPVPIQSVVWDSVGANESFTEYADAAVAEGINGVNAFYLHNPTAGSSKNITVTSTGSNFDRLGCFAINLKGCGSAPEAYGKNTALSTTTVSANITTLTDGAWILMSCSNGYNLTFSSFGSGQTSLSELYGESSSCYALTYEEKASAGLDSQSYTFASSCNRLALTSIAIPVGGTSSWPYTGSGGGTVSGTALESVSFKPAISGGATVSGSIVESFSKTYVVSGLVQSGGSADCILLWIYTGSGIIQSDGIAIYSFNPIYNTWEYVFGDDPMVIFGSAPILFSLGIVGSGLIQSAGSIVEQIGKVYLGSGLIQLTGLVTPVITWVPDISGIIQVSGFAEFSFNDQWFYTGSGIVQVSGLASKSFTWDYIIDLDDLFVDGIISESFVWSYNVSGGIQVSGLVNYFQSNYYTGSGLVQSGGTSSCFFSLQILGLGTIQVAGSAFSIFNLSYISSGLVQSAGLVAESFTFNYVPAIILIQSGGSPVYSFNINQFAYVGSGLIQIAASANILITYAYFGSGLIQFAGIVPNSLSKRYNIPGGVYIQAAGAAVILFSHEYNYIGSGLIQISGTFIEAISKSYAVSGILQFDGIFNINFSLIVIPDGGIQVSGVVLSDISFYIGWVVRIRLISPIINIVVLISTITFYEDGHILRTLDGTALQTQDGHILRVK